MRWRLPTKTASAVAVAAATMLCALALSPAALAAEPVAGARYVGETSQQHYFQEAHRRLEFTVSLDGRRIEGFGAEVEVDCTLQDGEGEYYQEDEDRIRIAADGSFRSRYRYEVRDGYEDFLIGGSFTGDGTAATGFFRLRTYRERPQGKIPPVDRCDSGRVTFEVSTEPPSCKGETATIDARSHPGKVEGTPGRDVIVGSAAEDTIVGRDGRDLICGRGRADELRGGKKRDRLFGQRGGDALFGERGDDRLNGGRGEDSCRGGRGDDTVRSC